MAAALVDDVVSPELALVDPELAARARQALPSAVAVEHSFAIGFEFVPEELLTDDPATGRRRNVVPLLALGSLVVAAIIGAGVLRGGPLPDASETWSASGATPVVASATAGLPTTGSGSPTTGSPTTVAPSTEAVVTTEAPDPVARVAAPVDELQPHTLDPSSPTRTPSLSTGDAVAPIAARPTELVWDDLGNASSYDIELIRNGAQIFAASAPAPRVDLPRSWTHDGERFSVRPEDEVFIWPVVDGRRGSRPLVSGTHVFDNTLVARFTG